MKGILMRFLAITFPWLVLLINDDPVGALFAMIMQVTIIGWIPASIWAWKSIKKTKKNQKERSTKDINDAQ